MTQKRYFINFTNHPSAFWDEYQIQEALQYGDEITDIPFPDIPATATEAEIAQLAEAYTRKLAEVSPAVVLCQGEFTFSYQVIGMLLKRGIPVLAACSKRSVIETQLNGATIKQAEYKFVKFRYYNNYEENK